MIFESYNLLINTSGKLIGRDKDGSGSVDGYGTETIAPGLGILHNINCEMSSIKQILNSINN